MIPSLVASEVSATLRDFVKTQFQPSNPRMAAVVTNFLNEPGSLLKGPYLSLSLPFQAAPEGGEPFPDIPLGFTPYRHQRQSFDRLQAGRSTVVCTGTGSGKTECFLLPILDYCRRRSGERGIKAILIYPMNALANDQADRIAKLVHDTPTLRGRVTAGIFIGQDRPSWNTAMTEDSIVSNRDAIVNRPPDILLTNYKMLDYLLSRPRDQRLWRDNAPDTLRWLVVDELHTFDGAQGTDLACLIRRLKARLGSPGESLVCVGTSATLGDSGGANLLEYVREVFATDFDDDAIVGESRQTPEQFLGGALITGFLAPQPGMAEITDPTRSRSSEEYLRKQFELFFGRPAGEDFGTSAWRAQLGEALRGHSAFHNLLTVLKGGPDRLDNIATRLRRTLPYCRTPSERENVINALCALISYARTKDGSRPFVDVGVHLWVRELRRMVCSLAEDAPIDSKASEGLTRTAEQGADGASGQAAETLPGAPTPRSFRRLRYHDDLDAERPPIHLPMIQCRTCRVTGWGAVLNPAGDGVRKDLRHFYNKFFSLDVDVRFLFPARRPLSGKGRKGSKSTICGSCGSLHPASKARACNICGSEHMVRVFMPERTVQKLRKGRLVKQLSRDCPYCDGKLDLFIFGARSIRLLSAAIGQVFSSQYNDDHKAIAFSDNVQDAAHRAAYLEHRTWRSVKRMAIAQAVPEDAALPISSLPAAAVSKARELTASTDGSGREAFVEQFVAPDRSWRKVVKDFMEGDRFDARLPGLVEERLHWEALAEAGFGAQLADSVQRSRVVAVGPDLAALDAACERARPQLREEVAELKEISARQVQQLALGVLRRMLLRGAVLVETVDAVRRYVRGGCKSWSLRSHWALPDFGKRARVPVFPCDHGPLPSDSEVERLLLVHGETWYQTWAARVVEGDFALAPHHSGQIVRLLIDCLQKAGLVRRHPARNASVWSVNPDRFHLTREVSVLQCSNAAREMIVPGPEAPLWHGAPCLDLGIQDRYQSDATASPTWTGRMYRGSKVRRIVAAEHTALLTRGKRRTIQRRFSRPEPRRCDPNLLSATPTLELGIDIGDLSTVALCSVPPSQANYLQRIGRAGRRDGNAFTLTVAAGRPHDLYFWNEPQEMLSGAVSPPGVFLNASAVLERQLTAFCLDNWAADCRDPEAVPPKIRSVLDIVRTRNEAAFPYTFFAFTADRRESLLKDFLAMFRGSLGDDSEAHLREFLFGSTQKVPAIEHRILKRLERLIRERKTIRTEIKQLDRRLKMLHEIPTDEAVQGDIREVEHERAGLRKLFQNVGARDTYGFLTDEGLTPNYAFPEQGVTLHSVILRNPLRYEIDQDTSPTKGNLRPVLEAYEYLRPAAAALSELAPNSVFYAEGHRVAIDRVDFGTTSVEKWRLCPSCPHCRNIETADDYSNCPRCGDPMWADSGQVRTMLPLRMVHATTPAKSAHIADDKDERESRFFERHLVADPDPDSPHAAFGVVEPSRTPFGFEYFQRTTFREMNFGPASTKGQPTKFAGRELPRPGFRVCKLCGRVQPRRPGAEAEHSWGCRKADQRSYAEVSDTSGFGESVAPVKADPDIIECLYLYREFDSESLRILVPVAYEEATGPRVQSFIAAVQLGLKEKFRGKVDHIKALIQSGPQSEEGAARKDLYLYDTVPGGTGYLKQLARLQDGLVSVLRAAHRRLTDCDCQEDGCYKCVRAYRPGGGLRETSKWEAIQITELILKEADKLEARETIRDIPWKRVVESELEARFIRLIQERAKSDSGMNLREAIVDGRTGWELAIGKANWTIAPQMSVGPVDRVGERSKPDFLLKPLDSGEETKQVAVFLDGFQYHRESTGSDSVKRMHLVRAGFLQWSITWQDLNEASSGDRETLDLLRGTPAGAAPPNSMERLQQKLDSNWSVGPLRRRLRKGSFDLLLAYLEDPDSKAWRRAVFVDALRLFNLSEAGAPDFGSRFEAFAKQELPEATRGSLLGGGGDSRFQAAKGASFGAEFRHADLLATMPRSALTGAPSAELAVALHLHDGDTSGEDYRAVWNGALRLFNLIQFLADSWWTTATGVVSDDYPDGAERPRPQQVLSDEWSEAIAEADETLEDLLRDLARRGTSPPSTVGFELTNAKGMVVAEAELAWEGARLAVARDDQARHAPALEAAGWSVFLPDVAAGSLHRALS